MSAAAGEAPATMAARLSPSSQDSRVKGRRAHTQDKSGKLIRQNGRIVMTDASLRTVV
ncbi:hypothetical protein GCM10027419_23090 [Pandoraea terrae]